MRKAKHKPPARVRYEESHPTVSCRLDRDTYTLLKQRLEDLGVSFADFVKNALGVLEDELLDIKAIKENEWCEGFLQAEDKFKTWYYCHICGKQIVVTPNGDSHKAIIRLLKEEGWGHGSCHQQKRDNR